ncbi:hypothetical protein A6769_28845 [Nostoc punctiforme NIES-2108]|uniref:CopG-like ribbon-helix-helix domain-containing protein n=1 Tax=Nostoc punctiforme NIES-2108 TaxID=1356359 RepID=A0A367R6U1_NOSPU|nr:hypothetical protein A6769_28845 [Nostoc punctiforme NIES-2108]
MNYFKPKLNGTNNPDASDRLTVYFSDDTTLKKIEEWAKEENRSASNLAATLLAKAVQDKDKQEKSA